MRFTLALIVALGGCSFVGIHDPDRPDSPFPLAMVVVGAWATASAIYGFTENARCRSALTGPAPGPASGDRAVTAR